MLPSQASGHPFFHKVKTIHLSWYPMPSWALLSSFREANYILLKWSDSKNIYNFVILVTAVGTFRIYIKLIFLSKEAGCYSLTDKYFSFKFSQDVFLFANRIELSWFEPFQVSNSLIWHFLQFSLPTKLLSSIISVDVKIS